MHGPIYDHMFFLGLRHILRGEGYAQFSCELSGLRQETVLPQGDVEIQRNKLK